MVDEFVKQLLEAGVHFGHPTKRWNPKMQRYIFGHKSGVYIIDLEKTVECLNKARDFLKDMATKGKNILFVGTKKQAQLPIEEEAKRCGMFYISQRWLGGLLTNFATIKKSINRLREIEKMKTDGTFEVLTKKEVAKLNKELGKLKKNFDGILNMPGIPDVVYLIDSSKEKTALHEARILKLPIVALIDTNCNPDEINFPIPGNDDAMRSIKLITGLVADSILEGRKNMQAAEAAIEAKKQAEALENINIDEIVKKEVEILEEKDTEAKEARPKVPRPKKTRAKEE